MRSSLGGVLSATLLLGVVAADILEGSFNFGHRETFVARAVPCSDQADLVLLSAYPRTNKVFPDGNSTENLILLKWYVQSQMDS